MTAVVTGGSPQVFINGLEAARKSDTTDGVTEADATSIATSVAGSVVSSTLSDMQQAIAWGSATLNSVNGVFQMTAPLTVPAFSGSLPGANNTVPTIDLVQRMITNGEIIFPITVAEGGTGANNEASARTNLGLATVANTGSYDDLSNIPFILDGANNITFTRNTSAIYSANAIALSSNGHYTWFYNDGQVNISNTLTVANNFFAGYISTNQTGLGYASLSSGGNTNAGYLAIYNHLGTRVGFIGYLENSLNLNADVGVINLNNQTIIQGNTQINGTLGATNFSGNSSGTNTGDQTIPTNLPPSGNAGGDLSGTYPNPTVSKIGGQPTIPNGPFIGSGLVCISENIPIIATTGASPTVNGSGPFVNNLAINGSFSSISFPTTSLPVSFTADLQEFLYSIDGILLHTHFPGDTRFWPSAGSIDVSTDNVAWTNNVASWSNSASDGIYLSLATHNSFRYIRVNMTGAPLNNGGQTTTALSNLKIMGTMGGSSVTKILPPSGVAIQAVSNTGAPGGYINTGVAAGTIIIGTKNNAGDALALQNTAGSNIVIVDQNNITATGTITSTGLTINGLAAINGDTSYEQLTVSGGIYSLGTHATIGFVDRNTPAQQWNWYAASNSCKLWNNNVGNIVAIPYTTGQWQFIGSVGGASPSTASNARLYLSGPYGGGIAMNDPGGVSGGSTWSQYTASGTYYWGWGNNNGGATTTLMYLTDTGGLTVIQALYAGLVSTITASQGYAQLNSGGATQAGYLSIFGHTGTRIGYIGYNENALNLAADVGVINLNNQTTIQGNTQINGSTATVGITFGSTAVTGVDLSKHINLFGGSYGFNITGSTLGYVVPTGSSHYFTVNGGAVANINATLTTFYSPVTINQAVNIGQCVMNGSDGWFRSTANAGWYSSTWGIGIYCTDATYVRAYNNAKMAANDFVISSDITLKENITDFEYRGPLHPKSFNWKSNKEHDIGFIAQEVEELYPEAVGVLTQDDGTEIKQLSYQKLSVVLAAQLNKLTEKVDHLESQVKYLMEKCNGNE